MFKSVRQVISISFPHVPLPLSKHQTGDCFLLLVAVGTNRLVDFNYSAVAFPELYFWNGVEFSRVEMGASDKKWFPNANEIDARYTAH